jgi:sugar/nucleoside kinase (ribokinase family)
MTEEHRWDVTAAGLLCLDITPEIPPKRSLDLADILSPGKLLNIGPAAFSTGGAVSNTGIVLKKLGLKVLFMSQVGDDGFGEITIRLLKQFGETAGLKVTPREGSSYSIVLAFPGIDRVILHHPGCNDVFSSESLDYRLIENSRLFHFGYPPLMRMLYRDSGRELLNIFKRVRDLGVATSLDTSLPDPDSESGRVNWKELFSSVLPQVDIFMPSLEEALYFLDPEETIRRKRADAGFTATLSFTDHRRIAGIFLEMGCGMVLLKCGARGLYFRSGSLPSSEALARRASCRLKEWRDREIWAPPFVIDHIVSATGAGDSSVGGFLAALLRGFGPEESVRFGACAGRQNLTALDAVSGIKDWNHVLGEAEALPVETLPWRTSDASWDDRLRIWRGSLDKCPGPGTEKNAEGGR